MPTTDMLLSALVEQAEWPVVSEWLVLKEIKFGVQKLPDGTRVLEILRQGSRRGYRIPIQPINAALIARELGSGLAVVPESDEVASAAQPQAEQPAGDEPPAPPTMGQAP